MVEPTFIHCFHLTNFTNMMPNKQFKSNKLYFVKAHTSSLSFFWSLIIEYENLSVIIISQIFQNIVLLMKQTKIKVFYMLHTSCLAPMMSPISVHIGTQHISLEGFKCPNLKWQLSICYISAISRPIWLMFGSFFSA